MYKRVSPCRERRPKLESEGVALIGKCQLWTRNQLFHRKGTCRNTPGLFPHPRTRVPLFRDFGTNKATVLRLKASTPTVLARVSIVHERADLRLRHNLVVEGNLQEPRDQTPTPSTLAEQN